MVEVKDTERELIKAENKEMRLDSEENIENVETAENNMINFY